MEVWLNTSTNQEDQGPTNVATASPKTLVSLKESGPTECLAKTSNTWLTEASRDQASLSIGLS